MKTEATILIVEDEYLMRWSLKTFLERAGYEVLEAGTGKQALAEVNRNVDLVLLDYYLPDTDGLALMNEVKAKEPNALVILMTAHSSVDVAVAAMKQGAYHYVTKPINQEAMLLLVGQALETTRLKREVRIRRANQISAFSFDEIIGESPVMQDHKNLLRRVATSPASTVLLTGESGTGKDLAAKVIHYNSDRVGALFMNVTCSALPEQLLESELFGYERGAFTGAKERKAGLFELAHRGTVFLDEVGEMPPSLQAKLLRFLEEKTFRRVGGSKDIRIDVRVIAATNRDLEASAATGEFREDLYYRLNVLHVRVPPLRERSGDVGLLAKYFVDRFNREFRKRVTQMTPEAVAVLDACPWRGNVRELRNVVERAMLLIDGDVLEKDALELVNAGASKHSMMLPSGGIDLACLERDLVEQALRRSSGNQTRAAALLGLNRDQIRYRIDKFGFASLLKPRRRRRQKTTQPS